jgi:cysteine desulfurase
MQTYFDYAATTPVDPEILDVYIQTTREVWGNPSGSHRIAQKARAVLEKSRTRLAKLLHTRPLEIYFTSTATEANNIAIQGVISAHVSQYKQRPHILISPLEHSSVSEFTTNPHCDTEIYNVQPNGVIHIDDIISRIRPETALICLMLVSNEIGTIQPVKELVDKIKIINKERHIQNLPRIYVHSDCVQASLYFSSDLSQLGVDFAVMSGHKLYAPRGAALLYVKEGTTLEKTIYGGGQERGLRSGTQNIAAIAALTKALELADKNRVHDTKHVLALRNRVLNSLSKSTPNIVINGDLALRIANNLHITIPNIDEDTLLHKLDLEGFAISAGSSCASGAHKKSTISKLLHPEIVGADLRITLGKQNTAEQVDAFCDTLSKVMPSLLVV